MIEKIFKEGSYDPQQYNVVLIKTFSDIYFIKRNNDLRKTKAFSILTITSLGDLPGMEFIFSKKLKAIPEARKQKLEARNLLL